MEYSFSTNSRVISDVLAKYNNTFIAFCELVNNSIQAGSNEIHIKIDQNPGDILKQPITNRIIIRDNGVGVSKSDFKKKIFEIGTDVKKGGKGIGRFAAFQLGAAIGLETVAFDQNNKKFFLTKLNLNHTDIQNENLEKVKVKANHEIVTKKTNTYYQVTITEFYDEPIWRIEKQKKIHHKLYLESIDEAIFMHYPIEILNDKISFFINGEKIKKDDYLIGNPEYRSEVYTNLSGNSYNIDLTFINYKSSGRDIGVFLRVLNNNIRNIGFEFKYTCDIPDQNSWLVYMDSEFFDNNQDTFRNLLIPDIRQDSDHLIKNLKGFIDKFFKEKFKEYLNFSKKLRDDKYYPYKKTNVSSESKSIAFNQMAYFIEKEYKVLSQNNNIRKIIYPLVDKAISHGELLPILEDAISLKDEHITKFKDLLERTELQDVITFSDEVAKKVQFLNFLDQIIYGAPSKHVKERSQLHKVIEKQLWLFGEQYKNTPILFSDKSLKNNLVKLRDELFVWEPDEGEGNVIDVEKEIKDITDLFFFNEKILDDDNREVMVVELKRPSCRISQKELNQLDRYRFAVEESGKFSQEIVYKLILISSDLTKFAKSQVGTENKNNPYLYNKSKKGNIFTYVIKWSDLIHSNNRKLSYLGNILKTKDRDVQEVFETDYPEIEISALVSNLSCVK